MRWTLLKNSKFLKISLAILAFACNGLPENDEHDTTKNLLNSKKSKISEIKTEPAHSIGYAGTKLGKHFYRPMDIRFDKEKNIYVLDSGNGRIVKLDSSGKYINEFGVIGQGPGEILEGSCFDIALNLDVIVADKGNYRAHIFDKNGRFKNSFEKFDINWDCIAVDSKGLIYLPGDKKEALVLIVDEEGREVSRLGKFYKKPENIGSEILTTKLYEACFDIDDDDFIYLALQYHPVPHFQKYDRLGNLIFDLQLDVEEVELELKTISQRGTNLKAQFVISLKVGNDGYIYILMSYGSVVYKIDKMGNVIQKFRPLDKTVRSQNLLLSNIAVADDGRIFAPDLYYMQVHEFRF